MDKRHGWGSSRPATRQEEALYAAIGFGKLALLPSLTMTEKERREGRERAKAKSGGRRACQGGEVKVENKETLKVKHEGWRGREGASEDLLVQLPSICQSSSGDDIVGYITKGHGVAILVWTVWISCPRNYEQRLLMWNGRINSQARSTLLTSISMVSTVQGS